MTRLAILFIIADGKGMVCRERGKEREGEGEREREERGRSFAAVDLVIIGVSGVAGFISLDRLTKKKAGSFALERM